MSAPVVVPFGEAPETLHRRSAFDISQTADAQKAALRLFDLKA